MTTQDVILLLLVVEAVLLLALVIKQCLWNRRTDATIAAINEDLIDMDADIEEIFYKHFPENEPKLEVEEESHASDEPADQG
jgi:hypothetical protein